jgi:glutathione S-transferase
MLARPRAFSFGQNIMTNLPAPLLTATVTLLAVVFYFFAAFRVGNLRAQLGIIAPATTGHPIFERAYRVQLNTLEQMGILLPLLWLTAFYPIAIAWIAPLIGLIWVIGRVIYLRAYMKAPETRLIGAACSGLTNLALLILAIAGIVQAWMAV